MRLCGKYGLKGLCLYNADLEVGAHFPIKGEGLMGKDWAWCDGPDHKKDPTVGSFPSRYVAGERRGGFASP